MSELFEKSMATLELPPGAGSSCRLRGHPGGKERCLALRPLTDLDDVARAQEETSAAVKMLILRGSPGFSGVKPVSASLQRADMGEPEHPGAAGHRLCAAVRPGARDYGDSEEKTVISHLFRSLTPNRFLEDSITNSILGEEEIADSASSELASIRRHMRAHRGQGAGHPPAADLLQPVQIPPGVHHHHPLRPVRGTGEGGVTKRHPRPGPRRVLQRLHLLH